MRNNVIDQFKTQLLNYVLGPTLKLFIVVDREVGKGNQYNERVNKDQIVREIDSIRNFDEVEQFYFRYRYQTFLTFTGFLDEVAEYTKNAKSGAK